MFVDGQQISSSTTHIYTVISWGLALLGSFLNYIHSVFRIQISQLYGFNSLTYPADMRRVSYGSLLWV